MKPLRFESIRLSQFTVFRDAQVEFSPGINLITGTNGSGKTHLMKALYSVLSVVGRQIKGSTELEPLISAKLIGNFRCTNLSNLISIPIENDRAIVSFDLTDNNSVTIEIGINNKQSPLQVRQITNPLLTDLYNEASTATLFFPVRELLTLHRGFIGAYHQRDTGFDETYLDLAIALDVNELRNPNTDLLAKFESIDEIKSVHKKDRQFYFKLAGRDLEADLIAEGYRKMGSLIYLIKNGMLGPDSVLFWDEPEANLNPRLIRPTAEFLLHLAKSGAQLFLSSHDYLLTRTLGVMADNPAAFDIEPGLIRFINLHFTEETGTQIEWADSLYGLEHNAILEEVSAHYEWEQEIILNSVNVN